MTLLYCAVPLFVLVALTCCQANNTTTTTSYGVDHSYPMHRDETVEPNLLGDKRTFYKNLIQGCVDHYGNRGDLCLDNERERIAMSLRQPQSMYNYTEIGFTKIKAPRRVFELLTEFWNTNRHLLKKERWPPGNTYTNHWERPSKMLSVEDKTLKGGGYVLKQMIWNAARDTISEWTGQTLAECSLYGIRVYETGSVLATHVDRLPLVSSAIINVDQDVDEPWPLEVIGHDGKAYNVTMEPGDLVLYESHSILHGRPFPLKGRFMANVFIHFEPVGPIEGDKTFTGDLPPYVIPGSPEEANWRSRNPHGHRLLGTVSVTADGATEAHKAAQEGKLHDLKDYVELHEDVVNKKDENGWTPLHEGVRRGDVEVVKYLIDKGSDINARTNKSGNGGSVLYWALQSHTDSHPIIDFLKSLGAKHYEPGVRSEL